VQIFTPLAGFNIPVSYSGSTTTALGNGGGNVVLLNSFTSNTCSFGSLVGSHVLATGTYAVTSSTSKVYMSTTNDPLFDGLAFYLCPNGTTNNYVSLATVVCLPSGQQGVVQEGCFTVTCSGTRTVSSAPTGTFPVIHCP